jgi:hypothetical protein
MDGGVVDEFEAGAAVFAGLWAAWNAMLQASAFVNDLRESVVIGRRSQETLSLEHRWALRFDWILTMFGTVAPNPPQRRRHLRRDGLRHPASFVSPGPMPDHDVLLKEIAEHHVYMRSMFELLVTWFIIFISVMTTAYSWILGSKPDASVHQAVKALGTFDFVPNTGGGSTRDGMSPQWPRFERRH